MWKGQQFWKLCHMRVCTRLQYRLDLNQREMKQIHVMTMQQLFCHHNSHFRLFRSLLAGDNHLSMNCSVIIKAINKTSRCGRKELMEPHFERHDFSSLGVRTRSHRIYTIASHCHWWIRYIEYGWMSSLWLVIHADKSVLSFRTPKDRKWTRLEHIPGAQSDRSINTSTIHPSTQSYTANSPLLALHTWAYLALPPHHSAPAAPTYTPWPF